MSEFLNKDNPQLEAVYNYAKRLIEGENGRMLFDEYKEALEKISAGETMVVFHRLVNEDLNFADIKANVGKILNTFFKSLNSISWEKPTGNHFIALLMEENRGVEILLEEVKPLLKAILKTDGQVDGELFSKLRILVTKLKDFELHYLKKEHVLFPYIEKSMLNHGCLQLKWSFHDDFRKLIAALELNLNSANPNVDAINSDFGKLFFVLKPIIFREEQILFPEAMKYIVPDNFVEMLIQSNDIGWCYGISPDLAVPNSMIDLSDGMVNLGTGALKPSQLILMLESLPVDITYVDEFDEVKYFSGAKHRIFPRTNAIIGRKVQNCHPAESVHIVNEIVDAFKSGSRDEAEFWIQMRSKFVHIRYFALRDADNVYRGTIEVSQDVTSIRALEGERRLLEWGNF